MRQVLIPFLTINTHSKFTTYHTLTYLKLDCFFITADFTWIINITPWNIKWCHYMSALQDQIRSQMAQDQWQNDGRGRMSSRPHTTATNSQCGVQNQAWRTDVSHTNGLQAFDLTVQGTRYVLLRWDRGLNEHLLHWNTGKSWNELWRILILNQ